MKTIFSKLGNWFSPERRFHFWVALGLLLASWGVYSAVNAGHFDYDDYVLIVENPPLRDLSGLLTVIASGRPLRGLTLMIDYALFGLDPRGYHLHNLLWHFLSCLLFYSLLLRLFGQRRLAALASLIFALHPVHTEAVMGIAHRKELLAFTFMMLSWRTYLWSGSRRWSLVLALFFFLLALLSKQVAIVLPLLMLVQVMLRDQGWPAREQLVRIGLLFGSGLLLLGGGLLLSFPIFRDYNLFGQLAPAEVLAIGYDKVLATSFSVFPDYLRLLLFPVHLCLDPQIQAVSFASPKAWGGMIFFLGLLFLVYHLRQDQIISFSLAWIVINLLPVMNWFPANAFLAERYLYIPSGGFCLLLAEIWNRLYEEPVNILPRRLYALASAAILFFLLVLILVVPLTFRLYALWPEGQSYFGDPARSLLWAIFLTAGIFAPLFFFLQKSTRANWFRKNLWTEGAVVFLLVGLMFLTAVVMMEGLVRHRFGLPHLDLAESVARMSRWLSAHARPGPRVHSTFMFPSSTWPSELINILIYVLGGPTIVIVVVRRLRSWGLEFSLNRGLAWEVLVLLLLALDTGGALRAGDWTSGVRLWRSTVLEEPGSITGWNNLGQAYFSRKRYALAAEAFSAALRLKPNLPDTHRNLGLSLLAQGKFSEAAQAFENALRYRPNDADSRLNLANLQVLLADQTQNPAGYHQAIQHYLHIVSLDPRSAHAYHNLAYCYYRLSLFAEARQALAQALAIDPSSAKSQELWQKITEAEKKLQAGETKPPPPP